VVPSLITGEDIEAIAKSLAGAEKFVIQQFAAEHCWDEALREVKPYPKEKLEEFMGLIKPFVSDVIIRGA